MSAKSMKYRYNQQDFLEEEWRKLDGIFGLNHSKNVFALVKGFYSESHRYYHTIDHIASCLSLLNEFLELAPLTDKIWNVDEVRLAIWFHDIIYLPWQYDNEERSAQLAQVLIVSQHMVRNVNELILLTRHFSNPPDASKLTPEGKLMLDLDLSIFGAIEHRFDKYEKEIEDEYNWVDKKTFLNGRLRAIVNFLNRDEIYYTRYFKENYGEKAIHNLNRSRISLRKQLGLE